MSGGLCAASAFLSNYTCRCVSSRCVSRPGKLLPNAHTQKQANTLFWHRHGKPVQSETHTFAADIMKRLDMGVKQPCL